MLDGEAEIVHFFAAIDGRAGDQNVRFRPRACGNAIHDRVSGVGLGREYEEDFVVLVIEFGERREVAFQARLEAFAGTEHGGARRVEARVGHGPPACVVEPLQGLQDEIESKGDLEDRKNVKGGFHGVSSVTERFGCDLRS